MNLINIKEVSIYTLYVKYIISHCFMSILKTFVLFIFVYKYNYHYPSLNI